MTVRRLREARSGMMAAWPNGWGWSDPSAIPPPGMFQMQRAGVPVTAHTSLQVDVVFTCLRVISNAIIKMGNPRAFTWAYDPQNRPYRKWVQPAPPILTNTWGQMWQFDGLARTVVSMGLFGEAFWLTLTRDRLQYPTALEVLHPAFVEVKQASDGTPEYFYGTGVTKKQLPTKDITHIPFVAMPGARRGLSSVEYAGIAYALALAAMEYGQRWFAQGASPSFILSADGKLGQDEVERIARKFLVEHSGLQSSHLPLVVDSNMKVEKVQSTPDEAQFIGTLEYARMCIAAWFGLPAHLAGASSDRPNIWGKTMQEMAFQLADFTLSGYIVRLEEAFSSLMPGGQCASFDESTILRANAADQAALIMALRQTQVDTPNDIRVEILHKAPIEGGDVMNTPLASNVAPGTASDVLQQAAKEDDAGDNSGGND
jgi:HK97 family phage portal protein